MNLEHNVEGIHAVVRTIKSKDGTTNSCGCVHLYTWVKECKALGSCVRSCVNKQAQLILANSGVGGLNEDVGIGLVNNLNQIAVGVLKVNTNAGNGNGNLIGVNKNLSLIASLLNIINVLLNVGNLL